METEQVKEVKEIPKKKGMPLYIKVMAWFSLIVGMIMLGTIFASATEIISSDIPDKNYRVTSQTGNESFYNVEFEKVPMYYNDVTSIWEKLIDFILSGRKIEENKVIRIDTIAKVIADKSSYIIQDSYLKDEKCVEKDTFNLTCEYVYKNYTYNVPSSLPIKVYDNKSILTLDSNINKEVIASKNIFTYQLNPLEVNEIRMGTGTITIKGDTTYADNSSLNVTKETGFAHLNISNSTPYDKLVLYMPFDVNDTNPVTNKTYDYSGKNNDGLVLGRPYWNTTKYGSGYWFGGVNTDDNHENVIWVTNTNDFAVGTGPWAISFWANFWQFGFYEGFFTSYPSESEFSIFNGNNDNILAGWCAGNLYAGGDSGMMVNNWYHIVYTRNSSGSINIYVNGSLYYTTTACSGQSMSGTGSHVNIGRDISQGPTSATLDEFMFFNGSLTTEQVSAIFNNQSARFNPRGEMQFWNLEEPVNNTANITLKDCQTYLNSNLTAKVNDGAETKFIGCTATNVNWTETGEANLTIVFNASANQFYSPVVIGNITFQSYLTESANLLNNSFISQNPSDITTFNTMGGLNITYRMTSSPNSINNLTAQLFYKTNHSELGCELLVNGSCMDQLFNITYNSAYINNYSFFLDDDEVLPSNSLLESPTFNNNLHYEKTFGNNQIIKIALQNVSNFEKYNIVDVMLNITSSATVVSGQAHYCNSSYISGSPNINNNCYQYASISPVADYNHSENSTKHNILSLPINVSNGMMGDVLVTNDSYFLFKGSPNNWSFWYVNKYSKAGANQISLNNGATYTDIAGTFDFTLHQLNGTEYFNYYSCVNDTSVPELQNCTGWRNDLLDLGGLPPSSPVVYSPTNTSYTIGDLININYTAAESPNGYGIMFYNLSLLNADQTFSQTIRTNNSQNLSFVWDTTGITTAQYAVLVVATDSNGLNSSGLSDFFILKEPFLVRMSKVAKIVGLRANAFYTKMGEVLHFE